MTELQHQQHRRAKHQAAEYATTNTTKPQKPTSARVPISRNRTSKCEAEQTPRNSHLQWHRSPSLPRNRASPRRLLYTSPSLSATQPSPQDLEHQNPRSACGTHVNAPDESLGGRRLFFTFFRRAAHVETPIQVRRL